MKSKFNTKTTLLVAAIIATLSITTALANVIEHPLKEQVNKINRLVKNKTLLETTNQIANSTGISFKIYADLETDVINQKLVGDNWNTALVQLLRGYNYTIISDQATIKTVVITGRNGSGENTVADIAASEFDTKLSGQYEDSIPASIMNVDLPMEQLAAIAVGEELTLDLPVGQYKVKHDSLVNHGDGTSTWVGYLDEEGEGYRMYLSQGDAGVIGNIYTPEGAYNIETINGQTVIVDSGKTGFEATGDEFDEASFK